MKMFVACLASETNTFSPIVTDLASFEEMGIRRGGDKTHDPGAISLMIDAIASVCREQECELIEGLCAVAPPGGRVLDRVYEGLRDEVLTDLRRAQPVDAVILLLHGAMAAESYDDCEGDLLERVRAIVGSETIIGVELDLHCHFTRKMQASADIVIAFKHYPHSDTAERARELAQLALASARGDIRPVIESFDCRMNGLWPTTREPIRGFVQQLRSYEGRQGVLSVSFGHGFPWGDVPEAGAKIWVVADRDRNQAQDLAQRLGTELWSMRHSAAWGGVSVSEALDIAASVSSGPVVMADAGDNPGGGAPGDSTFLLAALLERGVAPAAFGCLIDPAAVAEAMAAGAGAWVDLSIGAKSGAQSGAPLNVRAQVRHMTADLTQSVFGARQSLGPAVRVDVDGVAIILASRRQQTMGTEAFTSLGVELSHMRVIGVKSAQHFHAAFSPLASQVLWVSGPGALSHDFASLAYHRRDPWFWPRVDDPWNRP